MFYILLFFTFCHASFDQNLAIITQKPWLLKKLVSPGQVAALLQQKINFDIRNDIFDYQVFDSRLKVVTKNSSNSFILCDFALKNDLPSPVDLPKQNDQIFLSYDGWVYKNGSFLKIGGHKYAGVIHIPCYADYAFKAAVLIKNFLFVLDDCGYVSCLNLQMRTRIIKPWLNFFWFRNSDESVITEPFFEELNGSYFFEKGAWLQTRGVGLSISLDKKHLYLHTIDNRIVASEILIFKPMGPLYDQYPCELVKSDDINIYDLKIPNPVYQSIGGLRYDRLLFGVTPKEYINSIYKSFIRFKNRPIRQILVLLFVCIVFYIFKYKLITRTI